MLDRVEMQKMRANGSTYKEIANKFGVSKQRVHAVMGRTRRGDFGIEKIVFKGIYDIFSLDSKMTPHKLACILSKSHSAGRNATERVRRFIFGERHTYFTIDNINNLIAYTGMPYEDLFAKREVAKND